MNQTKKLQTKLIARLAKAHFKHAYLSTDIRTQIINLMEQ